MSGKSFPQLQPEVLPGARHGPDGGEDGLLFYRAIAEHWVPLLKPGGLLAVEIGETQAEQVCTIFSAHPLENIRVCQDWAGLDRVVLAYTGAAGVWTGIWPVTAERSPLLQPIQAHTLLSRVKTTTAQPLRNFTAVISTACLLWLFPF